MKTNDLKKGTRIRLRNGWEAELLDNLKGNTRMAKVFGIVTESGSVYAHDIVEYNIGGIMWDKHIEYTESQLKCKKMAQAMGF